MNERRDHFLCASRYEKKINLLFAFLQVFMVSICIKKKHNTLRKLLHFDAFVFDLVKIKRLEKMAYIFRKYFCVCK